MTKTSNKFDKNPDKVISCIENHVAKEVKNEINKVKLEVTLKIHNCLLFSLNYVTEAFV